MCIKIELLLQKGFHSIDRWFMNECEKHQLFLYCAKNFDDELVLEKQDLDFNLSLRLKTCKILQNTLMGVCAVHICIMKQSTTQATMNECSYK